MLKFNYVSPVVIRLIQIHYANIKISWSVKIKMFAKF
jgi:hypothetical protein